MLLFFCCTSVNFIFFFFNDTATTEIYTLSLHDALPICRLITISTTPVIAGDSFEMDAVGALRLSPLRRGLAIDSTVDIFTFYVPHRHVYGEQWIKFMKDGVNALFTINVTMRRSEERFSRNAETDLVWRLLLEKKKQQSVGVRGITQLLHPAQGVGHLQSRRRVPD